MCGVCASRRLSSAAVQCGREKEENLEMLRRMNCKYCYIVYIDRHYIHLCRVAE